MAPDMLTIPIMPESRLKATVQTTALIHAIASAACFVYRDELDTLLAFPSPYLSVAMGFAMAFHATFLFRLSIKQPSQSNTTPIAISAYIHLASAFVITLNIALRIFPYKRPAGFIIQSVAVGFQTITAIALLYFSHNSSVSYTATEVISL